MKNPSTMYGHDYIWTKGERQHARSDDTGHGIAKMCAYIMLGEGMKSFMSVGCGRGWVVKHMEEMEFEARGIEYGPLAEVKPVTSGVAWGDITRASQYGDMDFIECQGVLSHLPPDLVPDALRNIRLMAHPGSLLLTNILAAKAPVPNPEDYDSRPGHDRLQRHHQTVCAPEWWEPRFKEAGWVPAPEYDATLSEAGMNVTHWIWGRVWRAV